MKISYSMLIGSGFNKNSQKLLKTIARLSTGEPEKKLSADRIYEEADVDETEFKQVMGYLHELGLIEIVTIGGPLLYGHVRITGAGLKKAALLEG